MTTANSTTKAITKLNNYVGVPVKGRLAKFKVNPGMYNPYKPGFGHYFDVQIFVSKQCFDEYLVRNNIEAESNCVGLVQPIDKVKYSKRGTKVKRSPKVGNILLILEHLDTNIVSHEALHASTSFLRMKDRLELCDEGIDDNEECLAYTVGSLTKQIYNKIFKLGLEKLY